MPHPVFVPGCSGAQPLNRSPDATIQALLHGELPTLIRPISSTPHDRVLTVETKGEASSGCYRAACAATRASVASTSSTGPQVVRRRELEPVMTDSALPILTIRFDPPADGRAARRHRREPPWRLSEILWHQLLRFCRPKAKSQPRNCTTKLPPAAAYPTSESEDRVAVESGPSSISRLESPGAASNCSRRDSGNYLPSGPSTWSH
jgi:hypothetical protein